MNKPNLQTLISLQAYANRKFLPQRRKSNAAMSSEHASNHFGRGMDFAEFRHYNPGDDVRSIDWHVTARSGRTHIRLYREEKERPVFILVDQSNTMQFGTQRKFKSVLATELAALLAWSAFKNHDRVGGLLMGVADQKIISPQGGKFGVLNFLNLLMKDHEIKNNTCEAQLTSLRPLVKSSSVICLISDFEHFSQKSQDHIEQLSKHNDVLLIHISDPLEKKAPPPGEYLVSDGENELLLDTENLDFCKEYTTHFEKKLNTVKDFCQSLAINFYAVDTTQDFKSLHPFAEEGAKRADEGSL
jgi:uncharacterized protein (DUF58 family)